MPATTPTHNAHASGENESRELRFTRNGDGSYQCLIWWGRGNRVLGILHFTAVEMESLRNWLNEPVD